MDTIPAMLSPGEYILSPETVRQIWRQQSEPLELWRHRSTERNLRPRGQTLTG
jgi:hypothetical protein